ncbi:MAG: adenylosuccinate synthase [Dehalococcoidales bacterium]|jgi:adenylosuccinate synthase|nr:adenylosuccinate synthase [Dehalococcoidales bacterium]
MPVVAIIGAQWGDEGKGKVVDMLAEKSSMVVRFAGGDNAGHTVINPLGHFKLHLIPSGIFYPDVTCVIGNGVVVNPRSLVTELEMLAEKGVDTRRLVISDRAHLIMPYHTLLDELEEKSRGKKAIGTTLRGIGPAFTDKTARMGIRVGDLLDKRSLQRRIKTILENKNVILERIYGALPLDAVEVYQEYAAYADKLKPFIKNSVELISEAIERKELVLLEGAQGAMLDPDFGTYPFATSSSPLSGNASLGSGVAPNRINRVLGIYKAYCTRVGSGPLPTELNDEMGDRIREVAQEFGTTTGRPRRCGWFDGVAASFSARINGFTGAVITRVDVFDNFPSLKVCVAYRIGEKEIKYFPSSISELEKCQPVYEELPGWQTDTTGVRKWEDLPKEARDYITRLSQLMGCPVNLACIGPERAQTIEVSPIF